MKDELLELAVALASEAGRTIVDMRTDAIATATTKSSTTDPVTEADRRAEEIITTGILADRPQDSIVGEEGASVEGTSPVRWYVDPIDGTTNYLYGIPSYSVSIAAEIDGDMVVGVVLNPVLDELFTAVRHGGAFLNGSSIEVSKATTLQTALVGTGFSYKPEERAVDAAVIAKLLPSIRDIRRLGSAALDLCAVAMGRLDAYFETGLNVWDYAAGWLVVEEAGGHCRDLDGNRPDPQMMIAANTSLANDLAGALQLAQEPASVEQRLS